jgi:hypothetical protein
MSPPSESNPSVPAAPLNLRDTLFGDRPLAEWPPQLSSADGPAWKAFCNARIALAEGRVTDAISGWQRVIGLPDLESRHYAQAWFFLRQQGVKPAPEVATNILGVVMEVPVNGGFDLLAAYRDRSARYYNYSGAGVVWEHPDASLDPQIDMLLDEGQKLVRKIGVSDKPRPPAPPADQARLSFITPGGIAFGQGPFAHLAKDPLARSIVGAGTLLMQKMIAAADRPGA